MRRVLEIVFLLLAVFNALYVYSRFEIGSFSVREFFEYGTPIFIGCFVNFYLIYIIVEPFSKKKKWVFLILILLLSSTFLSFFIYYLNKAQELISEKSFSFSKGIIPFLFIITFSIGILGGLARISILWYNSIFEKRALEKKHSESKTALLLLKAQLNPHFLFNSLNNIDILIEENPKTASEYLKKLSDILRYVLYETKEDKTDLAKEISQIKSYVELQKIRTANPRYVNFNVNGAIAEQQIAPMIFLPFIENAFKHSKNKTIDNAIDISFEVSNSSVQMVCKNYYEAGQLEVVKNEGLGIETIEQRLNLLYPEKHNLTIEKTEHWFNVTLSILW